MKRIYPPLLLGSAVLLLGGCATEREAPTETTTREKIPMWRAVEQPDGQLTWEKTDRLLTVTKIPISYRPHALQSGEGAIWVSGSSLSKIDPKSNRVVATYKEASDPCAVGEGAIWAFKNTLSLWRPPPCLFRIDPATDTVTATIQVPTKSAAAGIAVGEGSVWVFQGGGLHSGKLYRIDPKSNQIIATLEGVGNLWGLWGGQVIVGGDAIWVMTREIPSLFAGENMASGNNSISRVNPAENRVVEVINLGPDTCRCMAMGEGALWVTQSGYSGSPHRGAHFPKLLRIDMASNHITRVIHVGRYPTGLALGAGSIWVCSMFGEVCRIDPNTNKVVEIFDVAQRVQGRQRWGEVSIVFADGSLWLVGLPAPFVYRIDFDSMRF